MASAGKDWVTFDVQPVGGLRRGVAAQTFLAIVERLGLVRAPFVEPCPAPPVTPKRIARVAAAIVFHHHEPTG